MNKEEFEREWERALEDNFSHVIVELKDGSIIMPHKCSLAGNSVILSRNFLDIDCKRISDVRIAIVNLNRIKNVKRPIYANEVIKNE